MASSFSTYLLFGLLIMMEASMGCSDGLVIMFRFRIFRQNIVWQSVNITLRENNPEFIANVNFLGMNIYLIASEG